MNALWPGFTDSNLNLYIYENLYRVGFLFFFLAAIIGPAVSELELVLFVVLFSGSPFVFI